MFEIAFRPKNLPNPTDTLTIGEDYVQCEMSRSSTDTTFWSASVVEGFYVCNGNFGATDSTNVCLGIAGDDANYTATAEGTSDWATPFTDDDFDNTWCTKTNNTDGDELNPYECSALKCTIERALDTEDIISDLAFTPTVTAPDFMVIQPGRARLYINKSDTQFSYPVSNDYAIAAHEVTV